jgi:acetyl esterase/lipase
MAYTSPWTVLQKLHPGDVEHFFQGFPATLVLSGEAEIARDAIRTFCDRLRKNIGNDKVSYHKMQDGEVTPLSVTEICPDVYVQK